MPPYKLFETGYYENNIFMSSSYDTDSYFYTQDLCKEFNSIQWFASDTGYFVDLSDLTAPLSGKLVFRLPSQHPTIDSENMKTIPVVDYIRYMGAMNEADTISNFRRMLDYCKDIRRTPLTSGYIWFMVDDYGDGTDKPILQLCIPLHEKEK